MDVRASALARAVSDNTKPPTIAASKTDPHIVTRLMIKLNGRIWHQRIRNISLQEQRVNNRRLTWSMRDSCLTPNPNRGTVVILRRVFQTNARIKVVLWRRSMVGSMVCAKGRGVEG